MNEKQKNELKSHIKSALMWLNNEESLSKFDLYDAEVARVINNHKEFVYRLINGDMTIEITNINQTVKEEVKCEADAYHVTISSTDNVNYYNGFEFIVISEFVKGKYPENDELIYYDNFTIDLLDLIMQKIKISDNLINVEFEKAKTLLEELCKVEKTI